MKLATGNMFSRPASLTLVTTNSYVRSNGTLVMGAGAAHHLKRYFLTAEEVFGRMILAHPPTASFTIWKQYKILTVGPWGIFQVKYHWGRPALPELITLSVAALTLISPQYESISLNYPGIGNGGLSRKVVEPLIELLPDNVTVWERF